MIARRLAERSSKIPRGMTLLLLALCLIVAALLRLGALDLMSFKHDHGVIIQMISQVVENGVLLTEAESSTRGPKNSPLPVYLLAPVWAVTADPLVLAMVIALMSVVAVGVTFWIGQRYFSTRAGLIAAACFAVSPWAVMYSRTFLREPIVTFFQVLLMASVFALIVDGRKRAIFWVCLWSGVVAQLYFTGYLSVVSVLLLLVLYRPKVSRPALFLGLAALGLLYLPYGTYLASGGWKGFLHLRQDITPTWIHQIDWMWNLVNIGNFSYLIAETSYYLDAKLGVLAFVVHPLAALERWIFIGGLGWLAWRILFPSKDHYHLRPVGLLLLFLVVMPAIVCLMSPWPCWPRYYVVSYPAQFLIIGLAIDCGLSRLRSVLGSTFSYRAASGLLGLTLAAMLLTQVHFTATLYSLLESSGGAGATYGVAYRHKVLLAKYLAKNYGPDCFKLTHEWNPLYGLTMGDEIEVLVRRRATTKPCQSPTQLYFLETINKPLSPEAGARLKPYRKFGPIVLYTKAAK